MAGGKGTRMEPFTKIFPKALLPVKEKPIIQHIIEKFAQSGVNKFFITVNYKTVILKSFFSELNFLLKKQHYLIHPLDLKKQGFFFLLIYCILY